MRQRRGHICILEGRNSDSWVKDGVDRKKARGRETTWGVPAIAPGGGGARAVVVAVGGDAQHDF